MNIVAGSTVRPLVQDEHRLGGRQGHRLAAINQRLKDFYDARPAYNRMAPLRLGNLEHDGWACLSGAVVKAANTRALSPFLVELCAEFYNDEDDEYQRFVSRYCRANDQFYSILYGAETLFVSF